MPVRARRSARNPSISAGPVGDKALGALSPREVQVLGRPASKVLTRLVEDEPQALRVCRLCD
jgi:hypothetical protein